MIDNGKKIELNQSEDGVLEITIHGYIGYDFTAGYLISALSSYYKDHTIILNIFSGGGSYLEAIAIYEYFTSADIQAEANIYGLAGSAATIIACACQTVRITENSDYFIHRASYVDGSDNDTKEIQRANDVITGIYRRKTGLSKRQIERLLDSGDEGSIITAQEAQDFGFVDEIIRTTSRKVESRKMAIAAYRKMHGIAPNIINQKQPTMANENLLEKVAKWMGLSSVDQIEDHIENNNIPELIQAQVQEVIPEQITSQIENSLKGYAKSTDVLKSDDIVNSVSDKLAPVIAQAIEASKAEFTTELEKRDQTIVELKAKLEGKQVPGAAADNPADTMESINNSVENDLLAKIEAHRKANNQK